MIDRYSGVARVDRQTDSLKESRSVFERSYIDPVRHNITDGKIRKVENILDAIFLVLLNISAFLACVDNVEDLVEEILGNIQDEFDNEDESIKKIGGNAFSVDGLTSVEDVEKLIGESLGAPEDCETLAAFILEKLGRIPQPEEKPVIKTGDIILTVSEIEDRRISKVLIMKSKPL